LPIWDWSDNAKLRDLFRGQVQTWPAAGARTGMCAGGKLNIGQRVDD
jgi:hypothetical protein